MRKAKSPSELGFTHVDRQRLGRALKQVADARSFRRIQAVLMFAEGLPIPQIARMSGSSERAVYQWIAWYARDHQVDVLYERPRSGRPAARFATQRARNASLGSSARPTASTSSASRRMLLYIGAVRS